MADYSFTINGVERRAALDTIRVTKHLNSHDTLDVDVLWEAGSPEYRTALDDLVILTEDSVTLFAGFITSIDEAGQGGANTGMFLSRVTAFSYATITQWRHVTLPVVGGSPGTTLKQFLTALIALGGSESWASHGMTLHPSQDDGPILAPMPFVDSRGHDILSRLAQDYGRVWRVDELNRLRMWTPGDVAAPFNIDEDDLPAKWFGDVPTSRTWHDAYANRVIVVGNTRTVLDHKEQHPSTGVETVFTATYKIKGVRGGVVAISNLPTLPPGQKRYEGLGPTGSGHSWEYDLEANTFTRTLGTFASGAVAEFVFDGEVAARGQADDLAEQGSPPRVRDVIIRTPVETDADAQARAEDILPNRVKAKDTRARYFTDELADLLPGQTQTITAPSRNLSGAFQLTQVTIKHDANRLELIREVETNQGNVQQGTLYQLWTAGASPGSVTGTDAGTGGNHSSAGSGSVSSNDSQEPGGTTGQTLAIPGDDTEILHNKRGGLGAHPGLRWLYESAAGIALGTPPVGSVANTGSGSYAATLRHYKLQWVTEASGVYTALSELSTSFSFTPSGSGTAARITRSTPAGSPTHWRVYGSADNVTYKQLSGDIAIATTTYDDSVAPGSYVGSSPATSYTDKRQLLISALQSAFIDSPVLVRSVDGAGDTQGAVSINPWDASYHDMFFGADVENDKVIARSPCVVELRKDDTFGDGFFSIIWYPNQTPGAEFDYGSGGGRVGISIGSFTSGAFPRMDLFSDTHPNVFYADVVALLSNNGDPTSGNVFLKILDAVNKTTYPNGINLGVRMGNAARTIRFDGVGTPVTFT